MQNNLKTTRKNCGFTQSQCAKELGVAESTYCYYEQGIVSPSMENLIKLADLFNCSIDYLLGHETKQIMHLDSFNPKQQMAIELIKLLDDDSLTLELGRLSQLTNTPLEEVLNKINQGV